MKTLRTVAGVILLILGVIGSLLPVLQGWMFFAAAVAVLGTDHAIVQWAKRRLERYAWARRFMERLGISKKEEAPGGSAPPA